MYDLLGFERPVEDAVGSGLKRLASAGPRAAGDGQQFGLLLGRQQGGHADDLIGAGQVEIHNQRGAAPAHHQFQSVLSGRAAYQLDFKHFEGGFQR